MSTTRLFTIHCPGYLCNVVEKALMLADYGCHPIVNDNVWTFQLPETGTTMASKMLAYVMCNYRRETAREGRASVLWSPDPDAHVMSFTFIPNHESFPS